MVFPAPGVVGEQEPQRLPRQHRLVDSGNLVGQRFDERSVDRQDRVKQVREPNPLCLGDQPEEGPIAVEAPRASGLLYQLQARLVVSGEELAANPAIQCLISQFERVRSIPLGADNRDGAVRQNATDGSLRLEFL